MVNRDRKRRIGPGKQLLGISIVVGALLVWQAHVAGGVAALWLTPDQQARVAYEALEFAEAYERFEDPAWKGVAAYRAGLYLDAAAAFGRIATAEGFFNRGNAFMKGREYAKAISAYEQAVAEAPDWREAQENLELAVYTLEYIERSREQSDTGSAELGPDDIVFDSTKARGRDMEITAESAIEMESAEKWMRSVDTETRDFLRTRFLLEANRGEQ